MVAPRTHEEFVRKQFWDQLRERLLQSYLPFPLPTKGMIGLRSSKSAGYPGLRFSYRIDPQVSVYLYIDTEDKGHNNRLFQQLHSARPQIEGTFGSPLKWEPLVDKRAARIRHVILNSSIYNNEQDWPLLQTALIDAMRRLVQAIKPAVRQLPRDN